MKRNFLIAVLICATLSGCAAASDLTPKTTKEAVLAAETAVTVAAATTKAYSQAGLIKSGSAVEKTIITSLTTAQSALNTANADIQSGNDSDAKVLTDVAVGLINGVTTALADAKANNK